MEKVESRGNAKGVNEEGFVEVRTRKNHGRGNYFQQKKQMFRPKETQNKGKDNGQSNVENGEICRKSANKFAVLADEDDMEKYAEKVDHDSKLVVDCFILNTKKPSAEEFQKWSQEMVQYFKMCRQCCDEGKQKKGGDLFYTCSL